MAIQIDPKLLTMRSGGYSSNNLDTQYSLDVAKQNRSRYAGLQQQDWDPVWRPVEHLFNALTAGGSAVMNAVDKANKAGMEADNPIAGGLAAIPAGIGGAVNGFFASWNNDPRSENYMTGSKLIENITDRYGKANDPNYKDVENNAEKVGKGAAGFALDVALDPLTYVPGGIFISATRGALRGGQAAYRASRAIKAGQTAEGTTSIIGGAARGVVKGAPDMPYQKNLFGNFKPIGLEQWKKTRDYQKFLKVQKKSGLTEEQIFALIESPAGVQRMTDEIIPGLRKEYGEDYLKDFDAAKLTSIADAARRYAPSFYDASAGYDAARIATSGAADSRGAAPYLFEQRPGAGVTPRMARRSARARAEAIGKRMDNEEALSQTEILRFDNARRAGEVKARLDDLVRQRDELVAGFKEEDYVKAADKAARRGEATDALQAEVAVGRAELDAIESQIAELRKEAARIRLEARDYALRAEELTAILGPGRGVPGAEATAQTIEEVTNYLAQTGVRHGGLIGLAGPEHAALRQLDNDLGLTEGASQILLGSLRAAIDGDEVADVLIGKLPTGESFGLKDLIDHLYGVRKLEGVARESKEREFLSGVIDSILYKMWDIARVGTSYIDEGIAAANATAGTMDDLVKLAVSEQAQVMIREHVEQLVATSRQLMKLTPKEIDESPGLVAQLEAEIADIEAGIRFLERGGSPANAHLAKYMLLGGAEAAAEAARIAGINLQNSAGYAEVILSNVQLVRDAIKKFDATDVPLEAQTNAIRDALGTLLNAHSATDDIITEAASLLGVPKAKALAKLIDVATGSFKPLDDAIVDDTLYGKLILLIAKLPIDIPGLSGVARERALSFADQTQLGVYGLETAFDDAALARYGRDMMNLFDAGGGWIREEKLMGGMDALAARGAAQSDEIDQLVERQTADSVDGAGDDIEASAMLDESVDPGAKEFDSEIAGGRLDQLGFAMGDNAPDVFGSGPYAAFDIFGRVIARGNTEDEVLKNFEIYRGAAIRQVGELVTDTLEAAIAGRGVAFSGRTIDEFTEDWYGELDTILSGGKTSNIFDVVPNQQLRGESVPQEIKRVLANSKAELGEGEMRIWGDVQLSPSRSALSFAFDAPFQMRGAQWRTGTHAFYGLQVKDPKIRASIQAAETAEDAAEIFKGVPRDAIDARYLEEETKFPEYYNLVRAIIDARSKLPGFMEELDATGFSNIIEQGDGILGGIIKEMGFTRTVVRSIRGANIVGKSLMRLRAKKNGYAERLSNEKLASSSWQGKGLPPYFEPATATKPAKNENVPAYVDEQFERLTGMKLDVPVSDHVLGYAREPLSLEQWVRVIQVMSESGRAGKFYDQYKLVSDRLGIPTLKADIVASKNPDLKRKYGLEDYEAIPLPPELLVSPAVTSAYQNYIREFTRYVQLDKESGIALREMEARAAMGKRDTSVSKKDFGRLRGIAGSGYGVDPLGRTFRNAKTRSDQNEALEKVEMLGGPQTQLSDSERLVSVYSPLAEVLTKEQVGAFNKMLKKFDKAENPNGTLERDIEDAFGIHVADQVIPIVYKVWGEHRLYGFTPKTADALVNVRRALIGSRGAARIILEDLAPRAQIARLSVHGLATTIAKAESVATDVKASRAQQRVEEIISGDEILDMTNPLSEFGATLLRLRLEPTYKAERATVGILDADWHEYPRVELFKKDDGSGRLEFRDIVTGGKREVTADPRDVMPGLTGPAVYNSLDEASVVAMRRDLGLEDVVFDKAIVEIAKKAQSFMEKTPDGRISLKGSPEEYRQVMTEFISTTLRAAASVRRGSSADPAEILDVLRSTSTNASAQDAIIRVFARTPGKGTNEESVDWLRKTGLTFSKFLERIETIISGKALVPGKSAAFDVGVGSAVARARYIFNLHDAGQGNLVVGNINRQNVEKFLDESEMDIARQTLPVDGNVVIGGRELAEITGRMSDEQISAVKQNKLEVSRETTTQAAARMADRPRTAKLAAAVNTVMRTRIRNSIISTFRNLFRERKYATVGPDSDRAVMHSILQEIESAAAKLELPTRDVAELKLLALRIADETYAELGVHRVAGLTKNNVGRYRYNIDNDIDWAYISYSDVLESMMGAGRVTAVTDLLTEILPGTVKDGRGLIFPPNVVAEMGVLSIKLHEAIGAGARLTPEDVAAIIYHSAAASLDRIPKGLFSEASEGTMDALPTGVNAARIALLADALADPQVAANIMQRHMGNAMAALAEGVEIGERNLAKKVIDRLMEVKMTEGGTLDSFVSEIISSTPAVRNAIVRENIDPDSVVAHVARTTTQRGIASLSSAVDVGIARVTRRMRTVLKDTSGKPVKHARKEIAAENARLARQRIEMANKLSATATTIRISELVAAGDPRSLAAAFEEGVSALPSSFQSSLRLAEIMHGGPATAEVMAAQREAAAELAAVQAKQAGAEGEIATLQDKLARIQLHHTSVQHTYMRDARKRAAARLRASRTTVGREDQIRQLDEEIARTEAELAALYGDDVVRAMKGDLPSDLVRVTLSSFMSETAIARLHSKISGSAGMQDLLSIIARIENSIDNNHNSYEKLIERVAFGIKTAFKGDDEAALQWGSEIFAQMFGKENRRSIDRILGDITDPELKRLAEEMYTWGNYVVGLRSEFLIRAGLDSQHVDRFIQMGPLGKTGAALFKMPMRGYEMLDMLPSLIDNMIRESPGTGKGGADWLTILKGYSWAFQRASLEPVVAAEFSARFGHTALGFESAKDAIEQGFQAVRAEGTLGQWLDPNQVYPPEFLRQMANAQRFLDTDSRIMNKWIEKIDKATSAIKSSITLWRVGHHVVNIMGETLMNAAAGVLNPSRYADAWRVMRSVGEFSPNTVFGHNYDAPLADFARGYKTDIAQDGAEGIKFMVAGRERVISYAEVYRMLSERGILLNNNTAEDIFVQGFNMLPGKNRATGIMGKVVRANEGLGAFSARRDNVFRIAHAIEIMKRKGHRSMNSMIDEISDEVMTYHPTMQMLSPTERKYARRLFFFYTWQRTAMAVIVKAMFDRPGLFTIPSKAVYELSVGLGGDPQSIGQPMPNDPRLPGFAASNILGPSWYTEDGSIWGASINAPQLDLFSNLLGEMYYDPAYSAWDNVWRGGANVYRNYSIGQFSPAINATLGLTTGSSYGPGGMQPITDYPQYLTDMTGLSYLSRITGVGLINNNGFLAPRTDDLTPEDQMRIGVNALTGLRFTRWSEWYDRAGRERTERYNEQLDELRKRLGITQ